MDEDIELKYDLKLIVDHFEIPMKPIVSNTLGNILEAILSEIKGIKDGHIVDCIFLMIGGPGCDICGPEDMVKIQMGKESLALDGWMQKMISNIIWGYLNTLEYVLSDRPFSEVQITVNLRKIIPIEPFL